MGIKFANLERAQGYFAEHGMNAEQVEAEIRRLWKDNNMDDKLLKAERDLICFGRAEINIENIQEK